MKVLVIYANDSKAKVDALRDAITDRFGSGTVLRLFSPLRKKSLLPHSWHKDAIEMMKIADIIVYAVSPNSSTNKNVNWELNKALKLNKHIVYLPMEAGLAPQNPCLFTINPYTKETVCLAEKLETQEDLFRYIQDFNSDAHIRLFNENVDPDVLMKQYGYFLETTENLVTRRQNVNSFYISANTALISVAGTIFALGSDAELLSKLIVIFALSIPGILLNISWHRMLQSYYINNQGKIKILSMIEKQLAVSLYDAEWRAMKNKFSKKKYISFTDNEKRLPVVFSGFFGVIGLLSLVFAILSQLP